MSTVYGNRRHGEVSLMSLGLAYSLIEVSITTCVLHMPISSYFYCNHSDRLGSCVAGFA